MESRLPGPSRFGALIMVTVLSCVILGAVWAVAIYLLPENPTPSERSSPSPFSPPPIQSPATPNLDVQSPTVHAAPPVKVQEASNPAQFPTVERSSSEAVPLPLGTDLKCAMEIDGLCSEDEGDRRSCLQRKTARLSIPCRGMLRERLLRMNAHMRRMRAACEADRRQYCRDESLGGGSIVQCLESHAQEVSDQCFQYLPKRGRLVNSPDD